MNRKKGIHRWIAQNTASLSGKTVAVTGSTGGLGRELCRMLLPLGASLILVDRNFERSDAFRKELCTEFPTASVRCVTADMENIESVRAAAEILSREPLDVLILNAGAYSIPRHKCGTGFDNVFEINFVSPYCLTRTLLPTLSERGGKAVAVGSIAHNYGKADRNDVDFSTRKKASQVYGNAKRYLMVSLYELFKEESSASLAVVHPGISLTGITAHYPKIIFAIIKHPMKVVFMKPRKACLSIVRGIFEPCGAYEWIGPRILDVWGFPKKKPLRTVDAEEAVFIGETAERIFQTLSNREN